MSDPKIVFVDGWYEVQVSGPKKPFCRYTHAEGNYRFSSERSAKGFIHVFSHAPNKTTKGASP